MNRRQLLQLTCLGASALLEGRLGSDPQEDAEDSPPREGEEGSQPSEIVEWEFETDVRTEAAVGEDPAISVNREKDAITVEGVGWYGSSHCGYLCAGPPEYDEESATLSVEVIDELDEDRGGEAGCGDDAAADAYRIEVRFDEGVPDRIEAEHPWERRTVTEPR